MLLSIAYSKKEINEILNIYDNYFFDIRTNSPLKIDKNYCDVFFKQIESTLDLRKVKLCLVEGMEAIYILYLIRKNGYIFPAIIIPHCNPYPFDNFLRILLLKYYHHPNDTILSGSNHSANIYYSLTGITSLPIYTFGIDNVFTQLDKKKCKSKFNLSLNDKFIIYTGRLMPDKNIDSLLDVYFLIKKKIQNVKLIIAVNHINYDYLNKLRNKFKDLELFYGLNSDELCYLYNCADLFVSASTSIFEIWGRSPLEALSCGVPCVLPKWNGFREYILESINGLLANVIYVDKYYNKINCSFAKIDVYDFASKCIYLLNNSSKFHVKQIKSSCQKMVLPKIRHLVKQTLQIAGYNSRIHFESNDYKLIQYILKYQYINSIDSLLDLTLSNKFSINNEYLYLKRLYKIIFNT